MSYTTIRAQVYSVLNGVTGTANIYNRVRFWKDREGKISIAVDTTNEVFHTWFIRRTKVDVIPTTATSIREHTFQLIGFYQVDDSADSEGTFQALCDTIMNEFDSDTNLNLNSTGDQLNAATLTEFDDVMVGDTLCHMAIIEIYPNEEVAT